MTVLRQERKYDKNTYAQYKGIQKALCLNPDIGFN